MTSFRTLLFILLLSCGSQDRGNYHCVLAGDECPAPDTVVGPAGPVGPSGARGPQGPTGGGCTAVPTVTGVELQCDDGTTTLIPYPEDGQDGAPGESGATGERGEQGLPGADGVDGTDCSVEQVSNGALITCGDATVVILNGTDGQDIPATAYTVVELVDPCGDAPGFDEVLLRLANGDLLAHYASGQYQFLTVVTPGNYVTTDRSPGCYFTVHTNGDVTW